MKNEHMLMYALVFVLGFMVARMMGGRLIEGWNPHGLTDGKKCHVASQCKNNCYDGYCVSYM